MRPFGPFSIVVGAVVASALAYRGMKRKSLSPSGAFSAWFVGFLSLASGLRGMVLFQFYIFGTAATKYRHAEKTKKDASAQDGSIRGPSQVLACSIVAVGCSLVHTYYCGEEKEIDFALYPLASSLTCGVIAHYATCLADTLASELGILAAHDPILVTMPWKKVPPGINGGITMAGTMWSGIGGGLMGLGTVAMDSLSGIPIELGRTVAFGSICGFVGSLIDSVLGAILQSSYYDPDKKCVHSGEEGNISKFQHISGVQVLTNAQVNLVSVIATTALGACVIGPRVFT